MLLYLEAGGLKLNDFFNYSLQGGELFNDLIVLEARMFKIIANVAAENMGKKLERGLSGVDRSNLRSYIA